MTDWMDRPASARRTVVGRIDMLDWLRRKGNGYRTETNRIPREKMAAETVTPANVTIAETSIATTRARSLSKWSAAPRAASAMSARGGFPRPPGPSMLTQPPM